MTSVVRLAVEDVELSLKEAKANVRKRSVNRVMNILEADYSKEIRKLIKKGIHPQDINFRLLCDKMDPFSDLATEIIFFRMRLGDLEEIESLCKASTDGYVFLSPNETMQLQPINL